MHISQILTPEHLSRRLFWTKAWGLVQGCTPVSPGCAHCWLAEQAHMRQFQKNPKIREQYQGLTYLKNGIPTFNGTVRLRPDRMDLPLRTRKPQVFAIWSDLLHENVPWQFIVEALEIMACERCEHHIFLIITKRPERFKEIMFRLGESVSGDNAANINLEVLGNFGPNIWLLTTVENQEQADKRLPIALQIPAAVRGILYEPALGPLDFTPWLKDFQWLPCGGETGRRARPAHPDWFRQARDDCRVAGVPFFLKSLGKWKPCTKPQEVWNKQKGEFQTLPGDQSFRRIPQKATGRFLDGRTWEELPG